MHYLKYIFCPPLRKSLLSHQYWVNRTPVAQQYSLQQSTLRSFNSCKIYAIKHYQHNINIKFFTRVRHSLFIKNIQEHQIQLIRSFKTSKPRYVHPAVWIVLRPLLKFAAVLTGRGFRKWWRDLPKDKKKYFLGVLKANRNKILATMLIAVVLSASYYQSHLEETPITKRKRFMAFNPKQLEKINEHQLNQMIEKFGPHSLPANHPYTRKVTELVKKILVANKDIEEIEDKKWGVSIIENSSQNAFVLPIGHVFMFTGMMRFCSNDDQLAAILAHEIAHCLQNHGAENISYAHILDLFSIAIIAAIWAMLPSDLISLLTHWLYNKTIELFFQLPYNRTLETEADKVGLQLAAKACFDVREASAFWSKMSVLKKTFSDEPDIEFLSTHPNHEHRAKYLDSIMDQAIKIRKDCGCPGLSYKDPRLDIGVSKALEITRKKFLEQYPKQVIIVK